MDEEPRVSEDAEEILRRIHHAILHSSDAQSRLQALDELAGLTFSSEAVLRALETAALSDKSKTVRARARQVLASPVHRYVQKHASQLPFHSRHTIVEEIASWKAQGLIQYDQAEILRQRYDFDIAPPPESRKVAPPSAPQEPHPTLLQTLLSQASITIALYLGAFFVIAAALILAALVEAARLPILLTATVLFGGAALLLHRRLPQPGFALFIVFSFLLPTDATVVADLLSLPGRLNSSYWTVVMLAMALLWGFSTWLYSSRWFSLASFAAAGLAAWHLGNYFDAGLEIYHLLFSLTTIAGLGAVRLLKKWRSDSFELPLFVFLQLAAVCLLLFSVIVIAARLDEDPPAWFLLTTLVYMLMGLFYWLSDRFSPFPLLPWMAVAAVLPMPLTFVLAFDADAWVYSLVFGVWGLLAVLKEELSPRLPFKDLPRYIYPMQAGSLVLFLASGLTGFAESLTAGFFALLAAAVVYTLAQVYQLRTYGWSIALLFDLAVFFTFFGLPFMQAYKIDAGYQMLLASLLLLAPDLFLTTDISLDRGWRWPPRLLGAMVALVNSAYLLAAGIDEHRVAWICYALYAIFFLAYALRYRQPGLGYLPGALAAVSLLFLLFDLDLSRWLFPLFALAAAYYLAGFLLRRANPANEWASTLLYSGLGVGALNAISAPLEGGLVAAIPVALAASLFAIEAFTRRNVWWGIPANLLYLMSYFMLLAELKVDEPQFYSIGAALLGMLMHYLLMRSGSQLGAFITGMLSQLVLLSTTYVQLVSTERLGFFLVLFFQALVVLTYGIVIRSRSLVITPIVFAVLAVATVVYSALRGIMTVLLIGCTGILLLALGILAVIMRDRLKQIGERFSGWQA